MLKARVHGVMRREGGKAEARRQREQGQLQRDAREIEDWRVWHRDVVAREEAEAQRRALQEQQQRRASRRAIAMNLLRGRGLGETTPKHSDNNNQDETIDGTDLLSDDDYATLFENEDDEDDEDDEENTNNHNNNSNNQNHFNHRGSTTGDMIKQLRLERTKRKRQELQRLRRMSMNPNAHQQQQQQHYDETSFNSNNNNDGTPISFFQDLDAEEELLVVQARLDYKVAVTNMVVCEHEERQQRAAIIEDEAFIWANALLGGYFARGCRDAVLVGASRQLLLEATEQRRIWFYVDYMVEDLENGIRRDFLAGRERIRQRDLYVLFESLDDATQSHLMSLSVADRERILDDLAVERFLKSKVNGLRRQKHSLIV